jgi:hypothetical protein
VLINKWRVNHYYVQKKTAAAEEAAAAAVAFGCSTNKNMYAASSDNPRRLQVTSGEGGVPLEGVQATLATRFTQVSEQCLTMKLHAY